MIQGEWCDRRTWRNRCIARSSADGLNQGMPEDPRKHWLGVVMCLKKAVFIGSQDTYTLPRYFYPGFI